MFASGLVNTTLTTLSVVELLDETIVLDLLAALEANPSDLQTLDIRNNNIDHQGAQQVSRLLGPLRRSVYRRNPSPSTPVDVNVASTLLDLDLSGNNIGSGGATHLGEALTTNVTLATLRLRGCEIGDDGAIALGAALRTNRSLDLLDVAKNEISDAGVKALINAVYAQQHRTSGAWKRQKDAETMLKKRLVYHCPVVFGVERLIRRSTCRSLG